MAQNSVVYYAADFTGQINDATVTLGTLPWGASSIAAVYITVVTAGVGAQNVTLDVVKNDGTTALSASGTVANTAAAAVGTVLATLGAGAVADSQGNTIKLRADFAAAVTSGPLYRVGVEVVRSIPLEVGALKFGDFGNTTSPVILAGERQIIVPAVAGKRVALVGYTFNATGGGAVWFESTTTNTIHAKLRDSNPFNYHGNRIDPILITEVGRGLQMRYQTAAQDGFGHFNYMYI